MDNLWIIYGSGWTGWWLSPKTPLKNMSSSIGMMTFPTEWENKTYSKPPTRLFFGPGYHGFHGDDKDISWELTMGFSW